MTWKAAPWPVLLTTWLAGIGIVVSLVGLLGLAMDPDRTSAFWQVYESQGTPTQAVLAGGVWLAVSALLLAGLVKRRVWAQFLAIAVSAWAALDWLADILSGTEGFSLSTTPLLLGLAYALFRTKGWFKERPTDTAAAGTPAAS